MTDINKFVWKVIVWIASLCILGSILTVSSSSVYAQGADIQWSAPVNISNSEGLISTDPFLLSDPSGIVHLFWAEKELVDIPVNQPDTLMYAQWDGTQWSKPIDIFFAPPDEINQIVTFPTAVLDDNGKIHLIWMGEPSAPNYSLFYSSVQANEASSPQAWQPRSTLAGDLTGTHYSIDIAYSPPRTLHIIYARVAMGSAPREERALTYIRSTDGGISWSEPVDIYTFPDLHRGASNTVLLVEPPDKVYASWTEWDDTGNGQAVWFVRSLDNGQTWEQPIRLAVRVDPEYERDWNNLALLGPNNLVAMWEGGWRAYRYGMYSTDGGVTWSEPIDTFPWLIGENGYAEFADDSKGRIHLFISQRIREGNPGRGEHHGLWHSIWEGGSNWSEPTLSGGDNSMLNPKIAIVDGNRVVVTWYTSDENEFEIKVMTGEIMDAPYVQPRQWPGITPVPTITPTPTEAPPAPTPVPLFHDTSANSQSMYLYYPAIVVLSGVISAVVIIIGVFILMKRKSGSHQW